MIRTLYLCEAAGADPYQNLALEEYLTFHTRPQECILYLWQNQRTVVIGRNQNAWAECDPELLAAGGGRLARRLSGGGAVYHDLGNLNFTFCLPKAEADLQKQLDVLVRALALAGIQAEKSGRNDLTVAGLKCSGNAFFSSGPYYYHHGTLMLQVDEEALGRYLTVDPEKLRAKGVASVRSRVTNLCSHAPGLTAGRMKRFLAQAAAGVYGLAPQPLPPGRLDEAEIALLREKYASWQWLYGARLPFTHRLENRWPWGGVSLELDVEAGRVRAAALYTDALQAGWFEGAGEALRGLAYQPQLLAQALSAHLARRGADPAVCADLLQLWPRGALPANFQGGGTPPPERSDHGAI